MADKIPCGETGIFRILPTALFKLIKTKEGTECPDLTFV
jgi:hypothetical protein